MPSTTAEALCAHLRARFLSRPPDGDDEVIFTWIDWEVSEGRQLVWVQFLVESWPQDRSVGPFWGTYELPPEQPDVDASWWAEDLDFEVYAYAHLPYQDDPSLIREHGGTREHPIRLDRPASDRRWVEPVEPDPGAGPTP